MFLYTQVIITWKCCQHFLQQSNLLISVEISVMQCNVHVIMTWKWCQHFCSRAVYKSTVCMQKGVLTSVELTHCWSHCAVRPFRGMPPLISSTGQLASRCNQATTQWWLVGSLQIAKGVKWSFVRKQRKVGSCRVENTETKEENCRLDNKSMYVRINVVQCSLLNNEAWIKVSAAQCVHHFLCDF